MAGGFEPWADAPLKEKFNKFHVDFIFPLKSKTWIKNPNHMLMGSNSYSNSGSKPKQCCSVNYLGMRKCIKTWISPRSFHSFTYICTRSDVLLINCIHFAKSNPAQYLIVWFDWHFMRILSLNENGQCLWTPTLMDSCTCLWLICNLFCNYSFLDLLKFNRF